MTGLFKGAIDAGCRFELEARAIRLVTDAEIGRVTGVVVEQKGVHKRFEAKRGVLLGTGGFEWNSELFLKYFPGPLDFIGSPRTNTGDGQLMAAEIDAELAHMDQANISYLVPTRYEGRTHGVPFQFHTVPNAILVNQHGRRFVSEFSFNLGKVLDRKDEHGQPVNLPAWLITDGNSFPRSRILQWFARHDPTWVTRANSIRELAEKIKLSPVQPTQTVARWNVLCESGQDEDFHRGETPLRIRASNTSRAR